MECRVPVGEVMSSPPVAVSPGGTVHEAVILMDRHGVGSVVVVEGKRPVGIFTERDLVRCLARRGREALGLPAVECGSRDLLVIRWDACILEAFMLLGRWRVRHAPVVDERGELVGVVSLRDLAYRIVEDPELLMDLVSTRAPEVSRDALYLLIRGLGPS